MRIGYRIRQFWRALFAKPSSEDLEVAQSALSASQMLLFIQMQPSEQAHSLKICHELIAQGETQSDLLTAALLHDVGKTRYPLHPWERAWIVLGRAVMPSQAKKWGSGEPRGWRRAFVVAEQHPTWGAELAAQAGASPLAVNLIRRHQERMPLTGDASSILLEDDLLHRLKALDEDS